MCRSTFVVFFQLNPRPMMASPTLSYRWLFTLLWKGQLRRHSNIGSLLDGYVNWSPPQFHLLYSLIHFLFRSSLPWSCPVVFAGCVTRPLDASIYLLDLQ